MTLGATADGDELNTELAAVRTSLANALGAGKKDHTRFRRVASLTNATALSLRSLVFTPRVGEEVRILYARGAADAAARTMTVTLEQADGGTSYLLDRTLTASVTSAAAATYDTRPTALDLRTVTGTRVRLIPGVRYRLSVATDAGTWTGVTVGVQVRTRRRRA